MILASASTYQALSLSHKTILLCHPRWTPERYIYRNDWRRNACSFLRLATNISSDRLSTAMCMKKDTNYWTRQQKESSGEDDNSPFKATPLNASTYISWKHPSLFLKQPPPSSYRSKTASQTMRTPYWRSILKFQRWIKRKARAKRWYILHAQLSIAEIAFWRFKLSEHQLNYLRTLLNDLTWQIFNS